MYFPYFATYMTAGLVVALVVFFWALRSGQFGDQQRARFLPLADPSPEPAGGPPRRTRMARLETVALFCLAGAGLAASAAVLIFALVNAGRV